jgi:hypothetical protein
MVPRLASEGCDKTYLHLAEISQQKAYIDFIASNQTGRVKLKVMTLLRKERTDEKRSTVFFSRLYGCRLASGYEPTGF